MRCLLVAMAFLCSTTLAFAADPVGRYNVTGTNPGNGSRYHGTLTVDRTGDTYRVAWIVGGTRYVRIGNDEGIWEGVWSYAGGRDLGAEVWKRQKRQ